MKHFAALILLLSLLFVTAVSAGAESDTDFVYLSRPVTIVDFTISGEAFCQDGLFLTPQQWELMKPGAVLEIRYSSETDNLWIVIPRADVAWTRINFRSSKCDGGICQIPFEDIAAVLGSDTSTWGEELQFESDGDWEVYSAVIGTAVDSKFVNLKNKVTLVDSEISGEGWSQKGLSLSESELALFAPGAVLEIHYLSEYNEMWILFPAAAAGWARINEKAANCSGGICQITYEEIAAVLGNDSSQWGTLLQFESDGDWVVYSVTIGQRDGFLHYNNLGHWTSSQTEAEMEKHVSSGPATHQKPETCKICGYIITPVIQHVIVYDPAVSPTCTEYGLTEGWHCEGCGKVTEEQLVLPPRHTDEDENQQCDLCNIWIRDKNSAGALNKLKYAACVSTYKVSTDAWTASGHELAPDVWALMRPGMVLEIQYSSESGDMWIVFPNAERGWTRVGQTSAARNGITCQIPYEQIAAIMGTDVSKWGSSLDCESDSHLEVYSVSVGSIDTNEIVLPATLTEIGASAFIGTDADTVIIPKTATTISSGAFTKCANLKFLVIQGNPSSIADDILSGCSDVMICCNKGSTAETWATRNGYPVAWLE